MRWFLADVLGLFSINVVPFSRNVVPSARIFSINPVPKTRMFSVPAIYVLGPLQILGLDAGNVLKLRVPIGMRAQRFFLADLTLP